jgi:hypothetical protein
MTPQQRAADLLSRWKAMPKRATADQDEHHGEVMLREMIAQAITQAIADHRRDLAQHGAIEQHIGHRPGRG